MARQLRPGTRSLRSLEGGPGRMRRVAGFVVIGVVVIVHGCAVDQVSVLMSDLTRQADAPKRMQVAYVRELEQMKPPAPIGAPPVAVKPVRIEPPKPPRAEREPAVAAIAASAASPEATPPPLPETVAQAASAAMAAALPASAAVPVVAAASAAAGFEWPASTKLTYALVGYYRGDVNGYASVEWVHIGDRYQVHLDVAVPPLLSRKMSSEGRLTRDGLYPERFDQDSKVAFRARQVQTMRFEPDAVVLVDGRRTERPAGLQDSTSQFVQLTYLFTMRPDLLVPGSSVEVPLALPRRLDRWIYDVQGSVTLSTVIGEIETMHLKPRRASPKDGDLSAEIWIAPSLHYLPVRIRLRQDESTFLDLTIDRKPQIAAQ